MTVIVTETVRRGIAVVALAALVAAAIPVSGLAAAGRHAHSDAQSPPKECIRFNARNGFYGNIWCTPAQQDRWDRWEAAQVQRSSRR